MHELCLWLTLLWRVGIPRCPQLNNEERWPADGVDQHNDQSHSHCLGHGFSDAWRWSGWRVRRSVIKGAAGRAWGQLKGLVGFLAFWAAQPLLMCWRSCCCHTFPMATGTLSSGRHTVVALPHLAVVCVIMRVVVHTPYYLSSPVPHPPSRCSPPPLPGPLVLLF